MNIDMDLIAGETDKIVKWDLSLKFDGIDYPIRRMTPGDYQTLQPLLKGTAKDAEALAVLHGLVEGEAKPVITVENGRAAMMVAAVLRYLDAHLKKTALSRNQAIAQAIAGASALAS